MPPEIPLDENKQIVITLALIQKALEDLNTRVGDHHKVLFGNGNPEESVVWVIRKLSEVITQLEKSMTTFCKLDSCPVILDKTKGINGVYNIQNLTWTQWGKVFIMKWFAAVCVFAIIVGIFHKPLTTVIENLAKFIGR